ncbi:MAG: hypothetical protein KatS3mg018_0350 [Fimbriimonadales bacterium]|nr:MAG: hypothetical protein KatS3mg018_0350 [Fimbriimonadales bacterium]
MHTPCFEGILGNGEMMIVVQAEFDGVHFVPKHPVSLEAGEWVLIVLQHPVEASQSPEHLRVRYRQMLERFRQNPTNAVFTDEQLRREHLYDEGDSD